MKMSLARIIEKLTLNKKNEAEEQEKHDEIPDMSSELEEIWQRTDGNYSDCLKRIEDIWERINGNQEDVLKRLEDIWQRIDENQKDFAKRMEEVWDRINQIEKLYNESGFQHLKGRLDARLLRLEVLAYYSNKENLRQLSDEEKNFIHALRNNFDYDYSINQPFLPDAVFPEKAFGGLNFEGDTDYYPPNMPVVQEDILGSFINVPVVATLYTQLNVHPFAEMFVARHLI